jgi:hypothetical protein
MCRVPTFFRFDIKDYQNSRQIISVVLFISQIVVTVSAVLSKHKIYCAVFKIDGLNEISLFVTSILPNYFIY